MHWSLDGDTGAITANGHRAGTVVESLPGKLYYVKDAAYDEGFQPGSYSTAAEAAKRAAIRAVIHHWMTKHQPTSQAHR
ncbi:hypothetical protein [Arthrobacter pigmenti]